MSGLGDGEQAAGAASGVALEIVGLGEASGVGAVGLTRGVVDVIEGSAAEGKADIAATAGPAADLELGVGVDRGAEEGRIR